MLGQILTVTWMNVQNIPDRIGSSLVIVVGIAGVVGVLLSVLAMSTGLSDTITNTGSGDRVVVLRDGAAFEGASFIPYNETQLILTTPGIAQGSDGKPMASIEMVTSINQVRRADDSEVGVSLRGLTLERLDIRPDIKLVDGRLFRSGLREVIVGELISAEFKGLQVGDEVRIRNDDWEVVGVYQSGDAHESGMITDITTMMSAYEQTTANSVVVVLDEGETVETFKEALTGNTTLLLDAVDEKEYYARAAGNISQLMFILTNVVAAIMATGALFGALNTMYTAVSARNVEIATLRALGFGSACIVTSVLVEALVLALVGTMLGATLAWFLFSGNLVSISSVVFQLQLTPDMMMVGIFWACAVGFWGGFFSGDPRGEGADSDGVARALALD